MAEDFELVADFVHWTYDENGDITMRLEPLPIASVENVLEGVPHLDGEGTYKRSPTISSDQYPSLRSTMVIGVV